MRYIDGYVLKFPAKKLKTYQAIAKKAGKIWMDCGALQYVEAVGNDLMSAKKWGGLPFPTMTKAKPTEKIIFSYIVYKSRKHRDTVNAKVHKRMEKEMSEQMKQEMPFDMKDMAYGGFEAIVDL